MQIEASVDELDIGSIKTGQEVRFTVEADPGQTYHGTVEQIRLVPETTSNVVYYGVIVLADNSSGKLLPGMTANVEFIKQKKDGVLAVPSAAFRFSPSTLTAAEMKKAVFLAGLGDLTEEQKKAAAARFDEAQKALAAGGLSGLMGGGLPGGPGGPGGMPGSGRNAAAGGAAAGGTEAGGVSAKIAASKTLWYLDDAGKLAVSLVQAGASDETMTELLGAEGLEGHKVIVKLQVR